MMEFHSTEYCSLLKSEADANTCCRGNPHCPKLFGDLCEEGCFEITIDLQTMTIVEES